MAGDDSSDKDRGHAPSNAPSVRAFPTASERAKRKRDARKTRARGKTLCGRGFHQWVDDKRQQFDVKSGRLVTAQRCARCGERRNRLT
ncbi:MAG: hypothetical protein AAF515_00110 [Pseudomonadota bacterium]